MQIAPIRPYNMSQNKNQQNTNFKGIQFTTEIAGTKIPNYAKKRILESPEVLKTVEGLAARGKDLVCHYIDKGKERICEDFKPGFSGPIPTVEYYVSSWAVDFRIDGESYVKLEGRRDDFPYFKDSFNANRILEDYDSNSKPKPKTALEIELDKKLAEINEKYKV